MKLVVQYIDYLGKESNVVCRQVVSTV